MQLPTTSALFFFGDDFFAHTDRLDRGLHRRMPHRPRRAYDHRIKEQIIRAGNPDLLPAFGTPRSTAMSWIRRGPREVVSLDPHDDGKPALRKRVAKTRTTDRNTHRSLTARARPATRLWLEARTLASSRCRRQATLAGRDRACPAIHAAVGGAPRSPTVGGPIPRLGPRGRGLHARRPTQLSPIHGAATDVRRGRSDRRHGPVHRASPHVHPGARALRPARRQGLRASGHLGQAGPGARLATAAAPSISGQAEDRTADPCSERGLAHRCHDHQVARRDEGVRSRRHRQFLQKNPRVDMRRQARPDEHARRAHPGGRSPRGIDERVHGLRRREPQRRRGTRSSSAALCGASSLRST